MEIMDYINVLMEYSTILLLLLGVLVFITNIIVEVIKASIPIPTNLVTVIVAVALTVVAMVIACEVLRISVMWYYAVGAVVMGVFVSYAAMFGYDALREAWERMGIYFPGRDCDD